MKEKLHCSLERRACVMAVGLIVMSAGIALLKAAHFGNDPFTGMCIAIGERLGVGLGPVEIAVNGVLFLLMLLLSRSRIGVGTLFNAFGIGYVVDYIYAGWQAWSPLPDGIIWRFLLLAAALLITCLGVSLYLEPQLGASPYDCTSLILSDRLPIPFFFCRMATDALCALACGLLGGVLGIGTILTAFCMGPFIAFFNRTVSRRLLNIHE